MAEEEKAASEPAPSAVSKMAHKPNKPVTGGLTQTGMDKWITWTGRKPKADVQYADQNSPFIKESSQPSLKVGFRSADEAAGTCEFLATATAKFVMNEEYSVGATLTVPTLSQIVYNLADNKIERFHIYYKTDLLQFWIGELLGGERTGTFIFEVFKGCDTTRVFNKNFLKDSSCMAELEQFANKSSGVTESEMDPAIETASVMDACKTLELSRSCLGH